MKTELKASFTGPHRHRGFSFAPSGLVPRIVFHPRLAPWAVLCRRFAAGPALVPAEPDSARDIVAIEKSWQ